MKHTEFIPPKMISENYCDVCPEYFISFKAMLDLYKYRLSQRKTIVVSHKNSQGDVIRQFFALHDHAYQKWVHYLDKGFKTTINPIDLELKELEAFYNLSVLEQSDVLIPGWADEWLIKNYQQHRGDPEYNDAVIKLTAPWLNQVSFYLVAINPAKYEARVITETPDGVCSEMIPVKDILNFKIPHGLEHRLERDVSFKPMNAFILFNSISAKKPQS